MAAATLPLTLMLTCGVQTMSDSEMEQLILKNRTIQQAVRHCPDSGTVLHVTLPVMRAWLEVTKNQEDCVQLYGELMTTIKASEAVEKAVLGTVGPVRKSRGLAVDRNPPGKAA